MFKIGAHLSVSKGFYAMGLQAIQIGANTFQFFTRNPRGGKAKEMDLEDAESLMKLLKEKNFAKILAHAPYTMNPASATKKTREFALMIMKDDLDRMEKLPGNLYNFHPGSHVKQGIDKGIELVIDALNQVLTPDMKTTVLLETMSGKGTEIGSRFEELRRIIDGVEHNHLLGICLDSCHIHDAGYDIANDLDGVLEEFDKIIGLDRLFAIHLNDSKNPLQSHKDRHEKIGEGTLGLRTFERIINHPKLRDLPFYLETPNGIEGYAKEIELLKRLYK